MTAMQVHGGKGKELVFISISIPIPLKGIFKVSWLESLMRQLKKEIVEMISPETDGKQINVVIWF